MPLGKITTTSAAHIMPLLRSAVLLSVREVAGERSRPSIISTTVTPKLLAQTQVLPHL